MTRRELDGLIAALVALRDAADDETALDAVYAYPVWSAEKDYTLDQRIRYGEILYRVVQAHTSQEGWEPPNVPALFTQVALPGEIPVWVQPTGAQDAYMAGDQVHYPTATDPVYESVMDYNVYDPLTYGWTLIE